MAFLNFQSRFAPDVASGKKRQTLRARNRFEVGRPLQLYIGMRTKKCRKLCPDVICRKLDWVVIYEKSISLATISSLGSGICWFDLLADPAVLELGEGTANRFARADGFKDFREMREWFRETYSLPFVGVVVYW